MSMVTSFRHNMLRNEFKNIQREMDEIFDSLAQSHRPWMSAPWRESRLLPLINIRETTDSFVFACEIPGINLNELTIKIEGDSLIIQGERKTDAQGADSTYLRRERASGSFLRSFTLPRNVDREAVTASYKNGVLKITLLKGIRPKARSIKVKYDD
ncbi:MAG: Hsp20/alpha crystallin family protein [Desulfomonilaceae bacterium]